MISAADKMMPSGARNSRETKAAKSLSITRFTIARTGLQRKRFPLIYYQSRIVRQTRPCYISGAIERWQDTHDKGTETVGSHELLQSRTHRAHRSAFVLSA